MVSLNDFMRAGEIAIIDAEVVLYTCTEGIASHIRLQRTYLPTKWIDGLAPNVQGRLFNMLQGSAPFSSTTIPTSGEPCSLRSRGKIMKGGRNGG